MGQMLQNVKGQLADLVEGGREQLLQTSQALQAPQVEDQEKEEEKEPPLASQQKEPSSSGDAYDRHQRWWQPIVGMKFDDPEPWLSYAEWALAKYWDFPLNMVVRKSRTPERRRINCRVLL